MSDAMEPLTVKLPEAQRLLGKLNELCNDGHLDRRHIGRAARVTLDSIKR